MDPAVVSRGRRLTRAVVYAALVAIPLGMLAFLVRTHFDPLVTLDQDIIVAATDYTRAHPQFQSFVDTWEAISQPWVMYLFLGLPVCLYVWFGKRLRTRAWWALATMAAGWAIAVVLKLLVRRARPVIDDPIAHHAGYSFPSGHATNNAIVVTVVIVLVWPLVADHPAVDPDQPRRALGDRDLPRQALRWRALPVRRHGRRAARMRSDSCVVRRLCGLETAHPHHRQHDGRFTLMAFLTRWQDDRHAPPPRRPAATSPSAPWPLSWCGGWPWSGWAGCSPTDR